MQCHGNPTGWSLTGWHSVSFLKRYIDKGGKKKNPSRNLTRIICVFWETRSSPLYRLGSCPVFMFCLSYSSRLPWAEKPAAPGMLSMGVKNSIIGRPSAAPLLRVSAFCPVQGESAGLRPRQPVMSPPPFCVALHHHTEGHFWVCCGVNPTWSHFHHLVTWNKENLWRNRPLDRTFGVGLSRDDQWSSFYSCSRLLLCSQWHEREVWVQPANNGLSSLEEEGAAPSLAYPLLLCIFSGCFIGASLVFGHSICNGGSCFHLQSGRFSTWRQ